MRKIQENDNNMPLATNPHNTASQKRKLSRVLINIMLALLAGLITIFAVEGLTRIFFGRISFLEDELGKFPVDMVATNEEFLAAYQEGQHLITRADWRADMNLWIPANYSGKYINVEDNIRVTTHQPENYKRNIYLFGGSTMYSVEVPDEYTIASILQIKLNERYPDTYRVINMGVMAYTVEHQAMLLKTIQLNPGDKVIFYDGVNDAASLYYCCVNHYGKTLSDLATMDEDEPVLTVWDERLIRWNRVLAANSIFYHNFVSYRNHPPSFFTNDETFTSLKQELFDDYSKQLQMAEEYTLAQSAEFYHFLQPNVLLGENKTYRESLFSSKYRLMQVGFDQMILEGYGVLKEALEEMGQGGMHQMDLSLVLDIDRKDTNIEFYYDWCHVNHIANEIIAEAIFQEIKLMLE